MMSMIMGPMTPSAKLWGDMMRMGIEAQFVMTMRTAGMLGLLPHGKNENTLMVSEKTDAVRESFSASLLRTVTLYRCSLTLGLASLCVHTPYILVMMADAFTHLSLGCQTTRL